MKPIIACTIFLFLLVSVQCSRLSYDIVPDTGAYYHSLRIKVNVKNLENGKRGNFKMLMKYNEAGDKIVFLSPLNTIFGILLVNRQPGHRVQTALLIANRKKKYWRGEFLLLIRYMWGWDMDINFFQFKQLMTEGIIPQSLSDNKAIKINVSRPVGAEKPSGIEIVSPDVRVRVKISNRKTASGRLSLSAQTRGMKQARLREILK